MYFYIQKYTIAWNPPATPTFITASGGRLWQDMRLSRESCRQEDIEESPKFLQNVHNKASLDPLQAQRAEATSQVRIILLLTSSCPILSSTPPHTHTQHTHPGKHKLVGGRRVDWREEQEKARGSPFPLRT